MWHPALIYLEVVSLPKEELEPLVERLAEHGYSMSTDHLDLIAVRGGLLP
jgi:hypothetical protein